MRKKIFHIITLLALTITSHAQTFVFNDHEEEYKPFKHMKIGATLGVTGIGIDVSTLVNKNINIRAGVSFMPKIGTTRDYSFVSEKYIAEDAEEERKHIHNLCGYLSDLIGDTAHQYVDESIKMHKTVRYINAKLLVDWYPFKNKHWHFTAGIYYGTSRFANAVNDESEAPTTVAINMYNSMYKQIQNLGEYEYPTLSLGSYSYELDPIAGQKVKDAFNRWGAIAVRMGTFDDGTPHYVTPDPDGVIRAYATSNALKPYLGCGYTTNFGDQERWSIGVEAGLLFWGKRHLYTSDGVCLIHDLSNVPSSVGQETDLLRNLFVLPNLEVRLAYTIF